MTSDFEWPGSEPYRIPGTDITVETIYPLGSTDLSFFISKGGLPALRIVLVGALRPSMTLEQLRAYTIPIDDPRGEDR